MFRTGTFLALNKASIALRKYWGQNIITVHIYALFQDQFWSTPNQRLELQGMEKK